SGRERGDRGAGSATGSRLRRGGSGGFWAQAYDGCTRAAELRVVELVGADLGMFGEEGVDGAAEVSNSLSVNDADLENAFFLAGGEVVEHEVLHLARLKAVEVEHAVNGQLNGSGVVHGRSMASRRGGGNRGLCVSGATDSFRPLRPSLMKRKNLPGLAAVLLAAAGLNSIAFAAPDPNWLDHDRDRPLPPVVTPATGSTQEQPGTPPSDAVVLFDGKDNSQWVAMDGSPTKWIVRDGYMECVKGSGYVRTVQNFGDCQLHVEWAAPNPPHGEGQGRGNSGVFFGLDRYEIQVLDSFENKTYADGSAAAVYGQYPPLVNASRPPGQWQWYDIIWTSPRFDEQGKVKSPARVTVFHNGVLVQNNVELTGPTSWLERAPYSAHPEKQPIALQDHGNPVRYRNIWVRELGKPGRKEFTLSYALLDSYTGEYGKKSSNPITVTREDRQLAVKLNGVKFVLFAESPTKFFAKTTDVQLEFFKNEQGKVDRMVWSVGEGANEAKRLE